MISGINTKQYYVLTIAFVNWILSQDIMHTECCVFPVYFYRYVSGISFGSDINSSLLFASGILKERKVKKSSLTNHNAEFGSFVYCLNKVYKILANARPIEVHNSIACSFHNLYVAFLSLLYTNDKLYPRDAYEFKLNL